MTARDWDAATYDRVSGPQVAMAGPVIERLALRGDETVLDAGCGSGRVTKLLLERLPRGPGDRRGRRAVDGRGGARRARRPGVEVIQSDLAELELDERGGRRLLQRRLPLGARPRRAVRPPARGAAPRRAAGGAVRRRGQRGALPRAWRGRSASEEPFAEHLAGWVGPWNFAGPRGDASGGWRAAASRTSARGSSPHPVVPEHTLEYLRTVCLGHHVERLPEELRDEYVAAVAERCGQPVELDYVRLNIEARDV